MKNNDAWRRNFVQQQIANKDAGLSEVERKWASFGEIKRLDIQSEVTNPKSLSNLKGLALADLVGMDDAAYDHHMRLCRSFPRHDQWGPERSEQHASALADILLKKPFIAPCASTSNYTHAGPMEGIMAQRDALTAYLARGLVVGLPADHRTAAEKAAQELGLTDAQKLERTELARAQRAADILGEGGRNTPDAQAAKHELRNSGFGQMIKFIETTSTEAKEVSTLNGRGVESGDKLSAGTSFPGMKL